MKPTGVMEKLHNIVYGCQVRCGKKEQVFRLMYFDTVALVHRFAT